MAILNVECSSIAKHDFWFARSGKREKRLLSGTNIAMSKMVFGFPTRSEREHRFARNQKCTE
jgi:hypothetical protein